MAAGGSAELIVGKKKDKAFNLTLEDIYHENRTSEEKVNLLCYSISNLHDLNLMMELILIGVCVNFPQPPPKDVEYSPLHTCVSYDMIEAISPLVDAGADIDIRTISEFPSTPLHLAINERKTLIVQELLAKGADPYCVLQGVVILPDSKIVRPFHWDCFEMAQLQRLQDTDSEEIWSILSQYKFLEGEEIKLKYLHWDEEPRATEWMFEPVAVSFHDNIFVGERRQRYDQFLYIFNIFTRQWTKLAFHGQRLMYGFTLAVGNDHVHIISGSWKNRETVTWSQDVFSLDYRFEWHKTLPPLKNARIYAASTYFDEIIVVAGGIGTNSSWLSSVEVLDCSRQFSTWWEIPNLPVRSDLMQATVTDDSVFFGCGSGSDKRIYTTKMVNIQSFLATRKAGDSNLSCGKYLKSPSILPEDFWKQLPPTPLNRSGLVSIDNCIVAVGGRNGGGKQHNLVHMYNSCKRCWIKVSEIKRSRFYPAVVASVVENKQELFVFFGCGAENSVEFCELF